ncbi:MAG: glycosyltransferase [Candidatus Daviesbacteria bacterium]|nr:glycosyltransferase [Candidatus Daviesbacteria bacterium]
MSKTIWGNCIVKNEDRFIWFAVTSVINYLDKLIIWDTGSSDKTVKIIELLKKKYPKKISFREYGEVDRESFTKAREEMLVQTKSDWVFLLDGDEIWWEKSIQEVVLNIQQKGDELDCIVNPTYNPVGDIYHYQESQAGQYKIAGQRGHFNIRAVNRKIPGLHFALPYGSEGFFDDKNKPIQERNSKKILFLDSAYLHLTHLRRSSLVEGENMVMDRIKKRKYEIGTPFPKDFVYPEVLYKEMPSQVLSPWGKSSNSFKILALIQTPFKKIKRRILDK